MPKEINTNQAQMALKFAHSFDIFEILYNKESMQFQNLKKELKMDGGNLSKKINSLSSPEIALLSTSTKKLYKHRAQKIISLTPKARLLFESFIEASKIFNQKEELDLSQIDLFLDVIENEHMPGTIKEKYLELLDRTFSYYSITLIKEHKKLKTVFENTLNNPKNNIFDKQKITMIKNAIPQLLTDDQTKSWVFTKIYPATKKFLQNPQKTYLTLWAVKVMSIIGSRSISYKKEIINQLLDLHFNSSYSFSFDITSELKNAVLTICCKTTSTARDLIKDLNVYIKSENTIQQKKAIDILNKIPQNIDLPRTIQIYKNKKLDMPEKPHKNQDSS